MSRVASSGWPSAAVLNWMRARIAAAGGDPQQIPDEPFRFWRLPEVERRTGLDRSTIYRGASAGTFPRPVPISPGRAPAAPQPEAA
jgi:predicted DNA-binding transcriptional regulator AlpA